MSATQSTTVALPSQGFKLEVALDNAGVAGVYGEIIQVDTGSLSLGDAEEAFHEFIVNNSQDTERTPKNQRTTAPTSFNLLFDPANAVHAALIGYRKNKTKVWLKVTSPDSGFY